MFVRQERLRKRPFGWAKQAHMHTPRRFAPVGEPPLLTFHDYTTAINFLLELRENNAIPSLLNTSSKYAQTFWTRCCQLHCLATHKPEMWSNL
jgi:hypothetical protein